jgi:thymidylate kinase
MRHRAEPLPRGSVVVLAGPDGAGKTALANQLESHSAQTQGMTRIHHRPRVLPSRQASRRPTEAPHAAEPYPPWISRVKVVYLALDYLLGWFTRIRPASRRGDLVLLERGWWDLVVDPRRYRLAGVERMVRAVGRVLPRPSLMVILDAEPDLLYARKPELPPDELSRQRSAWLAISETVDEAVILDATRDLPWLSNQVCSRLGSSPSCMSADDARRGRLVRLAAGGRTTWFVPSARPALAWSGLSIYHPMSFRARLGWKTARVLARTGAFRLLPPSEGAEAALESIGRFIPPGGTAAIAQGRRNDRFVALILDISANPVFLAKVALEDAGYASLRREVDALSRFGRLIGAPLRPPKVLREHDGVVLFEPVAWTARRHTGHLPEGVAAALGRFHAHHIELPDGEAGHPVHGDFAPWNLLRMDEHWVLVDWEATELRTLTFDDPFHFVLQASGHLGTPSPRDIMAAVDGRGALGAALLAFARNAELPRDTLKPSLVAFLERTLPQLHTTNAMNLSLYGAADAAERRSIEIRRYLLGALRGDAVPRET